MICSPFAAAFSSEAKLALAYVAETTLSPIGVFLPSVAQDSKSLQQFSISKQKRNPGLLVGKVFESLDPPF